MRFRYFAGAALAIAMAALPGSAQSAAQRLQAGVYAQQTAGDLDGAIRIFREIVASNPAQRVFAAQAQMHLAQALLQKGDLAGAAQEFTTLSANYSEFRNMIADMAGRMPEPGMTRVFSLGTTTLSQGEPDRYVHNLTHVGLTAPPGWRLDGDTHSSGGGDMVLFASSDLAMDFLGVWLKPAIPGTDIPGALRHSLEVKAEDRTEFTGWKVRPESVRTRVVAGQQALSAVADYTERRALSTVYSANGQTARFMGNEEMVEYLTWVRSPATTVLFFGRAKATDLAALQSGIDQLAGTAVIP
ncbi:MAG TPA: tetratricopeptide repeat protein [Bryobacteraceae bacterium]|nr:tetratricopeptide repeat protein [Bryobacteraceae bacterium]